MSDLRRRVVAAVGANAFQQVTTIAIQVASLPLFLRYWNIEVYGGWLLLSALPSYLSMADAGMVSAAGNKMAMAIGRGDAEEANAVFHSAVAFMTTLCGTLAVLTSVVIAIAPIPGLETSDKKCALEALSLAVFLRFYGGLAEQIFRATKRNHQGTLRANFVRIFEWAGYMVGLVWLRSYSGVAVCGLVVRTLGTWWLCAASNDSQHEISWGLRHATKAHVRSTIRPAFALMTIVIASAISIQGVTIVVAYTLGEAELAVFSSYRTLARVAIQLTSVLSYALWPEFSLLYGARGPAGVKELFRRGSRTGLAITSLLGLLLWFCGPFVLRRWTHGVVPYDRTSMGIMIIYAVVGGFCHVPRVLLLSTNRHGGLARWTLASALITAGLASPLAMSYGIPGICVALLFGELMVLAVSSWSCRLFFRGA